MESRIECRYIHNILWDLGGSIFFYKLLRRGKLLEPTLIKIYRTVETLFPMCLFNLSSLRLRMFSP